MYQSNNNSQESITPIEGLFNKRVVSELSDDELVNIDGGTTPVCWVVGTLITVFIATAVAGYTSHQ